MSKRFIPKPPAPRSPNMKDITILFKLSKGNPLLLGKYMTMEKFLPDKDTKFWTIEIQLPFFFWTLSFKIQI